MRITIGKAVSGDVRRLADLWTSLHKFHERLDPIFRRSANSRSWWIKFARETMSSPEGFVFVAKTGGRPVGYVLGSVKKFPPVFRVRRYGMISDMFVHSRFRGRESAGCWLPGLSRGSKDAVSEWWKCKERRQMLMPACSGERWAFAPVRSGGGSPFEPFGRIRGQYLQTRAAKARIV